MLCGRLINCSNLSHSHHLLLNLSYTTFIGSELFLFRKFLSIHRFKNLKNIDLRLLMNTVSVRECIRDGKNKRYVLLMNLSKMFPEAWHRTMEISIWEQSKIIVMHITVKYQKKERHYFIVSIVDANSNIYYFDFSNYFSLLFDNAFRCYF